MDNFWSIIWVVVWSFFFVAYLFVLFYILTDLFRDRDLSGWFKALVDHLPDLHPVSDVAGVHHRPRPWDVRAAGSRPSSRRGRLRMSTSSRLPARPRGGKSAADHISDAKALLDNGTINQAEFDQLKAKALA